MALGRWPDLRGTLPDRGVNPVPHPDSSTTIWGGWDILGFAYGVTESVDVGLDFSRGLHSVVRVAGGGHWAASISPAIYSYHGQLDNDVLNFNLSGLFSMDPFPDGPNTVELYTGAGLNAYRASLGTNPRLTRSNTAPTVLAGLRVNWVCWRGCSSRPRALWLVAEAHGTWLEQRTGRTDFVTTTRFYLRLQGPLSLPRGRRYPIPGVR